MNDTIEVGSLSYIPEAKAIIAQVSSVDMLTEPESYVTLDKYKLAPWGVDNDLPDLIMEKIKISDVVGSNLNHNINMMYGQGVRPFLRFVENGKERLEICDDERVNEFCENNDIAGYFQEECTDMATFFNTFPEIVLTADMKSVYSLKHKEAAFSRWGVKDNNTGEIIKHFYSSKFVDGATINNTAVSDVLNRNNPLGDLRNRIASRSVAQKRFMLQVNFATPGRLYYQQPYWWSIFGSGAYDYSTMIWNFKIALMKNGLAVRYIIYVSDKYWDLIFSEEKIDRNNPEAVKARKEVEFTKFRDFLSNEKNAGKGLMALKKLIPSANTAIEEKYIVIEELKNSIKGGEFLEDSSEVSNTINYAMQVHPSLIGSPPGKTGGSLSGTDKRELYHIKSAMMTPFRDRLLRPLYLVKAFNNFPSNLVWKVLEYEFTTLDADKTGKKISTNSDNNDNNKSDDNQ
jgi:hypothetical protein